VLNDGGTEQTPTAGAVSRLEGGDRGLWLATSGELANLRHGGPTTLTTADGPGSNQVRTLYRDHDGMLWIGTYGGGLNLEAPRARRGLRVGLSITDRGAILRW